jgi:hypothetical protein
LKQHHSEKKSRSLQAEGWSENDEVSAIPLTGQAGKTSKNDEGKERQNLKGTTAEGVSTNTSGNVVPNRAHYLWE